MFSITISNATLSIMKHDGDAQYHYPTSMVGVAISSIILCIVMLSAVMESHYAECRYAERHYAKRRYAERRYTECHGEVLPKPTLVLAKLLSLIALAE